MASDCRGCGGQGDIMCPGYAGRGCGPGEDAFGQTCAICDGATMVGCPDCEDLPPGPTWAEAIELIRQHDPAAAAGLEWRRRSALGLLLEGVKIAARIESEALDLYEELSQDGDRSTVTALESREVETSEPDPV